MLGFKRRIFEGLITEIQGDFAKIGLIDKEGGKSWLEISINDLENSKIICKPGCIFSFILITLFKWEKVFMFPIKRKVLSKEDFDLLIKFYKDKYGNV